MVTCETCETCVFWKGKTDKDGTRECLKDSGKTFVSSDGKQSAKFRMITPRNTPRCDFYEPEKEIDAIIRSNDAECERELIVDKTELSLENLCLSGDVWLGKTSPTTKLNITSKIDYDR